MKEYVNVFYFYNINTIGGIETFFNELVTKYSDYADITILYRTADEEQLKRLRKKVRCVRYKDGNKIKCKKAFFNYTIDVIDNIEAEEYIQIVHADFKTTPSKPNTHPKITKYISVSDLAGKSFEEITGLKTKTIYNPITIEEPKKALFLISATRLSDEKGKDRMRKLGDILNDAGIPYLWLIFTNDTNAINNHNIVYMKPRLDIRDYIAKADYLVQLSDGEAFCYSIVEALSLGTPVIATDMPVLKEIGCNKENAIIVDYELSNLDPNDLYKEFNFKYEPPKSEWQKELIKSKSNYKEELKMRFKVEALDAYEVKGIKDSVLKRIPEAGEQFEVDKERLDVLLGDNSYKVAFVKVAEVIEDIKEEVKEDIKETKKKPKRATKKKSVK